MSYGFYTEIWGLVTLHLKIVQLVLYHKWITISVLHRTCVSTYQPWLSSVTLRTRTQSSPLWSSWTTSTISAPSATFSTAFSTASITNGEPEIFLSSMLKRFAGTSPTVAHSSSQVKSILFSQPKFRWHKFCLSAFLVCSASVLESWIQIWEEKTFNRRKERTASTCRFVACSCPLESSCKLTIITYLNVMY